MKLSRRSIFGVFAGAAAASQADTPMALSAQSYPPGEVTSYNAKDHPSVISNEFRRRNLERIARGEFTEEELEDIKMDVAGLSEGNYESLKSISPQFKQLMKQAWWHEQRKRGRSERALMELRRYFKFGTMLG